MYIIKNALRCIGRSKGRNVLIGIIALVIAISACIGLSIRQAAESAKASALDEMSVNATIDQMYDCCSLMKIFIKLCKMIMTEQVIVAINIRNMFELFEAFFLNGEQTVKSNQFLNTNFYKIGEH